MSTMGSGLGVDTLVREAERLPVEEQLILMSRLVEAMQQQRHSIIIRRKWSEIRGAAPMPLVGEDAQTWVSRTRRESDSQREQQWRRVP